MLTCKFLNLTTNPSLPILRRKMFSPHLFPNCGNYHWAGSSRGERHLFEVTIYLHQPCEGYRNRKLGQILLPAEQSPKPETWKEIPTVNFILCFLCQSSTSSNMHTESITVLEILCIKHTTPSSQPSFPRCGLQDLVWATGRDSHFRKTRSMIKTTQEFYFCSAVNQWVSLVKMFVLLSLPFFLVYWSKKKHDYFIDFFFTNKILIL